MNNVQSEKVMLSRSRLLQLAIDCSLTELLQATVDEAEKLTRSQIGFYHLVSQDQRTLSLQTWSSNTLQKMCRADQSGQHSPVDQAGVWGDCIRQRIPVIHNDYAVLPHRKGLPPGHATVTREMVIPVIRGERLVAVLGVGNKPVEYDRQDIDAVSSLGDLAWDLIERKQALEALRESNAIFNTILNASNESVFLMETNGKVIAINQTTADRLGKRVEDLVGSNIYDAVPLAVAEHRQKFVDLVVRERRPVTFVDERLGAWIENNVYPVFDPDGQVRRVAIYGRDITEHRRAEEAQRESETRYRLLFETMVQGVVFQDASGTVIDANPAAERILGLTADQMRGRNSVDPRWQAIREDGTNFSGETHPAMQALKTGQPVNDVVMGVFNPQLDSVCWININAVPRFREGESQPFQVYTTFEDITDRKQLNETLVARVRQQTDVVREREIQYHSLFEQTHDAVFILDLQGRHVAANRRAAEMLGYTVEEMQGLSVNDLSAELGESQGVIARLLAGESIPTYERRFRKKDGQIFPVEISVELIRGSDHQPMYIQSVTRDITLRKQSEDALRRANNELERVMRMKDEFLAAMSHELRTPLTGILGLSEGLQELVYGPLNDRQMHALDHIYNSGLHLLDLINDILDVSKYAAGKLEVQMDVFPLRQVCLASLQMVRDAAQRKEQWVNFSMNPEEIVLRGDARRIKQILVNLLSNAVKFTREGKTLGLEVHGDIDRQVVALAVWDKGMGIKAEDFGKLFQPFIQLDASLARQQNGTGLGLVLVKNLVELHGGSIAVESSFGEGSRFTVYLPWLMSGESQAPSSTRTSSPLAVGPVEPQQVSPAAETLSLMIVDDDEINLEAISQYLLENQFRVSTARDGWECIKRMEEELPDIVLIDIQMPGMSGVEVIQRIRAHSNPRIARMLVIAITALAMPGDREKCLAAGADAYISKPLRLRDLPMFIGELTRSRFKK